MRLLSYLPYIAVLALALVAALGAAYVAAGAIERNTLAAVDLALEEDGHGWASASVDGLQVRLTGTAPNEAARFRALSTAGKIVDAARVIDMMEVDDPDTVTPPKFSVEILRNDDGISLIGLMPAATDRAAIVARVGGAAGDEPVTDLLELADYPVPEAWDITLTFALDALAILPRSKISATPGQVDITAISDSEAQKRRLETLLARARPQGITANIDISAPRPVITPFTLRFLIDDEGPRFDACSAGSDEGAATILAAAREAGMQGEAECTIGLGIPSTRWPQAVSAGIAAVAELGGGSITFSDADVSLIATDATAQAKFDRVVGELEAALPDSFSLHSVLPEAVAEDGSAEGAGPPEFVITRAEDGKVEMRGRVLDERARTAAESYAQALFGSAGVDAAMRLDEDLPSGWALRVLGAIEALSHLNSGSVTADPALITVQGITGQPNARAEITRLLSEKLGEGQNFEIAITYERTLDETVDIPTPEECVAAINNILNQNKITFAPGSSDIEGPALATLDRIAEQIRKCDGVEMEIGGHTDSQGREEMNLQLSQARADAVLDALLARRVLTSALTARGYGPARPIADNGTEEGRELNRRIEFMLYQPDEEDGESESDESEAESESEQEPETENE